METNDDLSLLREQRRKLTEAEMLQSDLDFAFHLQLEEALSASLASLPSSSQSSQPPPPSAPEQQQLPESPSNDAASFALAKEELSKLEQATLDREVTVREMAKVREDLNRRMHDHNFAKEIARIPEEDWNDWGDCYKKPYGEASSSSSWSSLDKSKNLVNVNNDNDIFRVYFKGLVIEEQTVNGKKSVLTGIGVAICGPTDNLILEVQKPLIGNGLNKSAAELKALIEGLSVAHSLGLKRVNFYCDCRHIYQYVTGRWAAKQKKIALLVDQVFLLRRKFIYCNPVLIARNDVKHAFKFAREAIDSQISRPAEPSRGKTLNENCVICLEDTDVSLMFSVDGCLHRFCFPCMRQHVEVKLRHGLLPKCPHEGCNSEINVDSSRKFLTPKLIETLMQRRKEASIPVTERVYCPYPKCSALMSKSEISEYAEKAFVGSERSGARKCLKCHGLFCLICKVPWHSNMTCGEYKKLNPNPPSEDVRLKSLATRNLWRQCMKCNHMIELSEGCYHMTCRCGHEFCYNCGAEWKNKKATCGCPLFDEHHVWHDDDDRDSDEEEEEEVDDSDEFYESDSDWY